MLVDGDEDHLSDGDYVAVLGQDGGRQVVRMGLVEGLLCPQGGGRKATSLSITRRLDIRNPEGRLWLRILQPVSSGATHLAKAGTEMARGSHGHQGPCTL